MLGSARRQADEERKGNKMTTATEIQPHWCSTLQVGDKVILKRGGYNPLYTLGMVARHTKTQCIVRYTLPSGFAIEARFRHENGDETPQPGTAQSSIRLHAYTDAEVKKCELHDLRKRLYAALTQDTRSKRAMIDTLDAAACRAVLAVLAQHGL